MKRATVEKIVVAGVGIAYAVVQSAYWYMTGRDDEHDYVINLVNEEAAKQEKSE